MANISGIRTHMKSVSNIEKITKAMGMVASAKLNMAQKLALASEPFAEKLHDIMNMALSDGSVLAGVSIRQNPLLVMRKVLKRCYVVIGSDEGLAGAYNTNIIKHLAVELKGRDNDVLVTVGTKIKAELRRNAYTVKTSFSGFSNHPTYDEADEVAEAVEKLYVNGDVDEVNLVYTRFKSAVFQLPVTERILPIKLVKDKQIAEEDEDDNNAKKDEFTGVIFEPSASEMLPYLTKYYIRSMLYTALLQGAASELASRMTSMTSATDNADDLLKKLQTNYNKARQSSITNEINEIVNGAEALK